MKEKSCKCVVLLFHILCWISTITVTSYQLYTFILNDDLCIVDYKTYYNDPSDVYPVLSLCFKNPFMANKFVNMNTNINETSYKEFLDGKYFSSEMWSLDYNSIILDMSEYVVMYWMEWRNGSHGTFSHAENKIQLFRSTYSGFWRKSFYNCYGLQMNDAGETQSFSVMLKNQIFPTGNRPIGYDFFTLIHYPNQLLRSTRFFKYAWPQRKNNDTYSARFRINQMEIIKRRNKYQKRCNVDWENHDNNILMKHLRRVGCRAPYQNSTVEFRNCSTSDEMKKARFSLRFDEYGVNPPCKSMEKVMYSYTEAGLSSSGWSGSGHFWIGIYFRDPTFKEIAQTR